MLTCLADNLRAFARLALHRRTRPQVLQAFVLHAYLIAAPAARPATWWTDSVVADAQAVAVDVRRNEGVPTSKITVIPNGPRQDFEPARAATVETPMPLVVCVAAMTDRYVSLYRELLGRRCAA
jgi:hypothetical protein